MRVAGKGHGGQVVDNNANRCRKYISTFCDRDFWRLDSSQSGFSWGLMMMWAGLLERVTAGVGSRSAILNRYDWDQDEGSANHQLPTGLRVSLRGDPVKRRLALRIDWTNTGVQQHRKVGKWVTPAAQSCVAVLKSLGWNASHVVDQQAFTVEATMGSDDVARTLDQCANSIDRAMEPLRME